MPSQDRIGRDNRGQFHQRLATEGLAFDGQQATLIIGQKQPFLPLRFHQGFDLRLVELDNLLLFATGPADEDHEENLPGM